MCVIRYLIIHKCVCVFYEGGEREQGKKEGGEIGAVWIENKCERGETETRRATQ